MPDPRDFLPPPPWEGPPLPRLVIVLFPWMSRTKALVDMPLELIVIPEPWSPARYENNRELILQRGSVPPIEIGWSAPVKKFVIADGIHRSNVARDLGYQSIPAFVYHGDLNKATRALGYTPWSMLSRKVTHARP